MKTLLELKSIYSELNQDIESNEISLKNISRRENRKEHKALSKIIQGQQDITFDLASAISDMEQDDSEFATDSGYLIDFLTKK